MTKFKIFGIGLLLILVASCQKDELPQSVSGSPEFTSNVTFNGQAYSLSAGEMNLVQTSEYTIDGTEITMTGKLSNPDCATCGPGFKLTVISPESYDYSPSSDLLTDLGQWNYSFEPGPDTTYSLLIHAFSGDPGNSGNWILNGNLLNNFPIDSLNIELSEPGLYWLNFESTTGNCNLESGRSLVFDGESIPCYGNIFQLDTISTSFTAFPGPSFNPATTSYSWFYNDTIISTGNSNHFDVDSLTGITEMCVDMVDAEGCTVTACTTFEASPAGGTCSANIFLENPQLIPIVQSSPTAKMILEFTDDSGILYSSENGGQSNSITLISAENYTEPTMPNKNFIKVKYELNGFIADSSLMAYPFSATIVTAFEIP